MVEHRSTWSRRISIISVAVVFFLCTLVLVGWKVHRTELVEVIPNLPPMSPWSAICFLGLSGALFLKLVQTLPQFQKKSVVFLQFILITTSLCIALIHFIENFTVIKFQIDDLLFPKFVKELDAFNMAHMSFQA
jgi:hypothetical protein